MNADPKLCVVFEVDMKIWPYRNSRHLRDQPAMLLIDEKVLLAGFSCCFRPMLRLAAQASMLSGKS